MLIHTPTNIYNFQRHADKLIENIHSFTAFSLRLLT